MFELMCHFEIWQSVINWSCGCLVIIHPNNSKISCFPCQGVLASCRYYQMCFNSSPPGKKWPTFCRQHFLPHFYDRKVVYFNITYICIIQPQWINWGLALGMKGKNLAIFYSGTSVRLGTSVMENMAIKKMSIYICLHDCQLIPASWEHHISGSQYQGAFMH